jgi:thiol-disulfide isomerase/thioredoxin
LFFPIGALGLLGGGNKNSEALGENHQGVLLSDERGEERSWFKSLPPRAELKEVVMKKLRTFVVVFLLVFSFIGIGQENVFAKGSNFIGKVPPEINISSSFNNKTTLSLTNLKGKVVLVEFWATWCPPCRQAISHLKDLRSKYASKGLVIIAITAEDKGVVKKFIKDNRMNFAVAIDDNGKTNSAYGIRSIPTAYLVGADGKVVWQGHTMSLTAGTIEKALKNVKSSTTELPVW